MSMYESVYIEEFKTPTVPNCQSFVCQLARLKFLSSTVV